MKQAIYQNNKFLSMGYYKSLIVTMVETVKIDENLLNRIKKLITDKAKRIKYSSKKQFINIAVLELLEKEEVKR